MTTPQQQKFDEWKAKVASTPWLCMKGTNHDLYEEWSHPDRAFLVGKTDDEEGVDSIPCLYVPSLGVCVQMDGLRHPTLIDNDDRYAIQFDYSRLFVEDVTSKTKLPYRIMETRLRSCIVLSSQFLHELEQLIMSRDELVERQRNFAHHSTTTKELVDMIQTLETKYS